MNKETKKRKYIDMTGVKVGNWIVVGLDIERSETKRYNPTYWLCKCPCGKIKSYSGKDLRGGLSKVGRIKEDCGCVPRKLKEAELENNKNNPQIQQPKRLKRIYCNMKGRCTDPNNIEYFRYGARDIALCDRWLESFDNFYSDMFQSYVEFESINGINSATIDRIDSTGNYELSNCRWLTLQQQARNRKDNLPSTVRGKDYGTLMELLEEYTHLPYKVVQSRYHKGLRGEDLIAPYYGIQKPFSETRKVKSK